MLFDRTCEFEMVYRNSGRNMSQPPNDLRHKGIQTAFTTSDEDPGNHDEKAIPLRGRPDDKN
jgi:hypothetical protein